MKISWRAFVLFFCILLLISLELANLFLLSPMGLTQKMEASAPYAHFLTMNIFWFRLILLALIIGLSIHYVKAPKRYPKVLLSVCLLLYSGIFYMANFVLKADRLFVDQITTETYNLADNVVPLDEDILGVVADGVAKAYPLDFLAYHHKVADSVGQNPIIATYCIWCRCGRVFSSVIDGEKEEFRLVGMTEYNAIVEDQSSKTWWQQATGEAIAGKKKGAFLKEMESYQMPLERWIEKYPNTEILQPDTLFNEMYEYNSKFVSRFGIVDSTEYDSWERMSWVIGVVQGDESAAFDYVTLIDKNILQEKVGDLAVAVVLQSDTINFHVWDRKVDSLELDLSYVGEPETLVDRQTQSVWGMDGKCISGDLKGKQLTPVQAYEEYWHSWKTFHKNTKQIPPKEEE